MRVTTREQYEALLAYFRSNPNRISSAARTVGVGMGMAKRAWLTGWPENGWPAVKDVLDQEQVRVRALLAEQEALRAKEKLAEQAKQIDTERMRERATQDAEKQRAQEINLVRISMSNVGQREGWWARVYALLFGGRDAAGSQSAPLLTPQQMAQAIAKLDPDKLAFFFAQAAKAATADAHTRHLGMQDARLWAGEPTAILGVVDMTPEEALEILEMGQDAVERARTPLKLVTAP